MALTNAQVQAAYRARHIKDLGDARRLDIMLDSASVTALRRMAAHHQLTQRAVLEKLLDAAQTALLRTLDSDKQDAYYDRVRAR